MDTNNESAEIDPTTFAQISSLIDSGDEHLENNQYDLAIDNFERALSLVPEPIYDWEITSNLLTALGETYLFKGEYEKARKYFSDVMKNASGLGNPYVHLRFGQTQFELGEINHALQFLASAYIGGGEEIFEDEDPKYFALVKSAVRME